jgi:hypothetical protein
MNEEKGYMTRGEFCAEAARIVTSDRNEQYGEPEDNFAAIAELWSVYLNRRFCAGSAPVELWAGDVAVMMTLFKIARETTAAEGKEDSVIDAIGYLACYGEITSAARYTVDRCLNDVRESAEVSE